MDTIQVTYAARDSDFDGHQIRQGDYLAMYNKSLFATSRDLNAVLRGLAEQVEIRAGSISRFFTERISQRSRPPKRPVFSPPSAPMPMSTCSPAPAGVLLLDFGGITFPTGKGLTSKLKF